MLAIRQVAGAEPGTCPWRAFEHPFVMQVLDLYRAARTDNDGNAHLASVRALNPPSVLWDGLQWYSHALAKCLEQARKDREAKAEAQRRVQAKR